MAADVVLVNPPHGDERRVEHFALGYLAAPLRRAGIRTEIVDAGLLEASIRQAVDVMAAAAPRVVGITVKQRQGRAMVAIAQGVRCRLPQTHITAGGHFPTFCHERLLKDVPALDSVVRGEGDLVFVDLVQRLLGGDQWHGLPGLSFRQDGCVAATAPGPLIPNLDELPFPARDTAGVAMRRNGFLSMYSSRGCYGKCTFCSGRAFHATQAGPAWRGRSVDNVVEEMVRLAHDYGCKSLGFTDDNFIGPGAIGRKRAHAFADALIRRRPRFEFAIACRADDVEPDLFRHLREAGLCMVELGIESGNQRQLDRLRKGLTGQDNKRALSILNELCIPFRDYLIMFDPDSTLGECLDTLRFVASEGALRDTHGFENAADPLDGTELCERLRQQGRLRGSYLERYSYS